MDSIWECQLLLVMVSLLTVMAHLMQADCPVKQPVVLATSTCKSAASIQYLVNYLIKTRLLQLPRDVPPYHIDGSMHIGIDGWQLSRLM